MTDLTVLAVALRGLLGPGIGVGVTDPGGPTAPLWPEEAPAMARAVPKRWLEFAAGRHAVRVAMAELGLPLTAIPMGNDRAPVWPKDLVGSIAHCDTACIAVVAHQGHTRAIGVDIEPATPLAADLWETVCTLTERTWLDRQPATDRGILAKLIFSAKESVYKAIYPLTGQVIGFEEVEISCELNHTEFSAYLQNTTGLAQLPEHLTGQNFLGSGHIISVTKFI